MSFSESPISSHRSMCAITYMYGETQPDVSKHIFIYLCIALLAPWQLHSYWKSNDRKGVSHTGKEHPMSIAAFKVHSFLWTAPCVILCRVFLVLEPGACWGWPSIGGKPILLELVVLYGTFTTQVPVVPVYKSAAGTGPNSIGLWMCTNTLTASCRLELAEGKTESVRIQRGAAVTEPMLTRQFRHGEMLTVESFQTNFSTLRCAVADMFLLNRDTIKKGVPDNSQTKLM